MTETKTSVQMMPIWTDLGTTDPEAARAFYRDLFGWNPVVSPDPEVGGYGMFFLDDKVVAGIGPLMNPQQPPVWTTYIGTPDADETVGKIGEAGGQVLFGPMQVMTAGRLAIAADPTGAVFGLWEPGDMGGANVFNTVGAMSWNELNTRDMPAAREFYRHVFGWEYKESDTGGMPYTEWLLDGRSIGGGMTITEQMGPDVPPHWLVYFSVEDAPAALARGQELGGAVIVPVMDIGMGYFAILRDPQGAHFAIFAAKPESNS